MDYEPRHKNKSHFACHKDQHLVLKTLEEDFLPWKKQRIMESKKHNPKPKSKIQNPKPIVGYNANRNTNVDPKSNMQIPKPK